MFVPATTRRPRTGCTASCSSAGSAGEQVIDLGDITAARGLEMWLPLWLRLMGATGTPAFNLRRRAGGLQQQHDAVGVGVTAEAAGGEDGGLGLAEPRREATARLLHHGAGGAQRRRQTAPDRARDPGPARPVAPDERRQTAGMVGVQVRDHECVEAAHAQLGERRLARRPPSPTDRRPPARSRRRCAAPPRRPARRRRRRRAAQSWPARPSRAWDSGSWSASSRRTSRFRCRRRTAVRTATPGSAVAAVPPPSAPPPPLWVAVPAEPPHPLAARAASTAAASSSDHHARVCRAPLHRVTLPARADASCPAWTAGRCHIARRRVQPRQPAGQKEDA